MTPTDEKTGVGPLKLRLEIERWPLTSPFRISGHTWHTLDVLVVILEGGGHRGRGEAAGVYYRQENPETMKAQIESIRAEVERGLSRQMLMERLPQGGARNALDCALWDLEAKMMGKPVWKLAGLEAPKALTTTFTCGADTPEKMAATAQSYTHARAIKLKLTGEPIDAERLAAVRSAQPDAWLGVDANQGFTRESLEHLMRSLVEARVSLIEQPFPVGQERWLDDLASPIPIGADESAQGLKDLEPLVGRFGMVNLKLDKCGGLTEGLLMVSRARALGLNVTVGNMIGTSLAMAPACLLGQGCRVVDLDGPVFLMRDRTPSVRYLAGQIECPPELWGYPQGWIG